MFVPKSLAEGRCDLYLGDALEVLRTLPDESVDCVVTSPPYYGLRDYGVDGQMGLEQSLPAHLAALVGVFREIRRVLKPAGTVWLNYGDAYASTVNGRSAAATKALGNDDRTFRDKPFSTVRDGFKPKDRMMLPARAAIALQDDGWYLRDEIVWAKTNPMPSSIKDRTTPAHEMIYLLTKSKRYHFDYAAIEEPCVSKAKAYDTPKGWDTSVGAGGHGHIHRDGRGALILAPEPVQPRLTRRKRSVWSLPTEPFPGAHYATFPQRLVEPCVLAGCPRGGVVLDPFAGSGTVGLVALRLGRLAVLVELKDDGIAEARIQLDWSGPEERKRRLAKKKELPPDQLPLFSAADYATREAA